MDRAGCILNEKANTFGNPWRVSRTSIRGIYDEESVDEAERELSMEFLLSSVEISSTGNEEADNDDIWAYKRQDVLVGDRDCCAF